MALSWLFPVVANAAEQAFAESKTFQFYGHLPEEYKRELATFHRDWASFMDVPPPCFEKVAVAWLRWVGAAGYRITALTETESPTNTLVLDLALHEDKLKSFGSTISLSSIVDAERSNEILFRFW